MYGGLPLATLVGDEGEDVAHLLQTIYKHGFYNRDSDDTPLEVVTGLLLLNTKCDFKAIRRAVIFLVSKHFLMTFREFGPVDNRDAPLFYETRRDYHIPSPAPAPTRQVNVLLPPFYTCSSFTIRTGEINDSILGVPTHVDRGQRSARDRLEQIHLASARIPTTGRRSHRMHFEDETLPCNRSVHGLVAPYPVAPLRRGRIKGRRGPLECCLRALQLYNFIFFRTL